jgi:hypothetical protein
MNNPLGGVDADGHADPALPQEEIIKLHDACELVVTGYRVFSEHIMGSVAVSPPAKCPVDQCVYVHAPLPPDPRVDFWCGNKTVCNPEVEREKWIAQRDFILGHNRKNAPNNGPSVLDPKPTVKQKFLKWVCKNSSQNRIIASMEWGAATGMLKGAIAGATGGAAFEGVGAVPGAFLGGFAGGVFGAGGGVLSGGAMAGACSLGGAY